MWCSSLTQKTNYLENIDLWRWGWLFLSHWWEESSRWSERILLETGCRTRLSLFSRESQKYVGKLDLAGSSQWNLGGITSLLLPCKRVMQHDYTVPSRHFQQGSHSSLFLSALLSDTDSSVLFLYTECIDSVVSWRVAAVISLKWPSHPRLCNVSRVQVLPLVSLPRLLDALSYEPWLQRASPSCTRSRIQRNLVCKCCVPRPSPMRSARLPDLVLSRPTWHSRSMHLRTNFSA